MLNALKVSCLFVGAVVGAGFATGREVMLYFAGAGWASPFVAGLLMGCVSGLFLAVGKFAPEKGVWRVLNKATDFAVFCAMVITFAVMCSAAEQLFCQISGVQLIGLACGLICAVLACFEMKFIKNLSLVLVVLLIACIAILYSLCTEVHTQDIDLRSAVKYCGMNMLTGGCLIKDEGKGMTVKQIFLSVAISALVCAGSLTLVHEVALSNAAADMPVYDFAAQNGMSVLGAALILAAVLSTLLGAGRAACSYLEEFFESSFMPVLFLCCIAVIGYSMDFSAAVDTFYPVMGVFGTGVCVIYALSFAAACRRKLPRPLIPRPLIRS